MTTTAPAMPSPQVYAAKAEIHRLSGCINAAVRYGWPDHKVAALRDDLTIAQARYALLSALDGITLTPSQARDLTALIRERVAA